MLIVFVPWINLRLTPDKYYSGMGKRTNNSIQAPASTSTRTKSGIWLALVVALGLHTLLLLLPLPRQAADNGRIFAPIAIQLTTTDAPRVAGQTPPASPLAEPVPSPEDIRPEPQPLQDTATRTISAAPHTTDATALITDLERMNKEEKARLTRTILSSPFISEDSAADQLFGNPIDRYNEEINKEFHLPERSDLLAMLDRPMQDLPFEYTPGLIRFAYKPGIIGDLQRFGDKITPEFGWITKYGTEVRCVWVLVIAACGWGRPSAMGVSKSR